MERVCAPLRYHPCATVTKVVGTTSPPSFAAAGYAAGFRGFGPPPARARPPALATPTTPAPRSSSAPASSPTPRAARSSTSRCSRTSSSPRTAARPPRLHVFDVRIGPRSRSSAWGDARPPGPRRRRRRPPPSSPPRSARSRSTARPSPSARTRASCTRGGSRSASASACYARLLSPLKVDAGAVVRARGPAPAHRVQRRQAHVRVLGARHGKLRGAFCVDGVAKGAPLVLTADAGSVCARARLRRRLLVRNDLRRRRIRTRRRAPRR